VCDKTAAGDFHYALEYEEWSRGCRAEGTELARGLTGNGKAKPAGKEPTGAASRKGDQPDVSLTDAAVNIIRDRILDLTLPPSSRIDETMLAERFALSRTPAREALNRLAAEGLVQIQHNRGAIVRPLDLANVHELFEAYFLCERIVGFLCKTGQPGLLADLRSLDKEYHANAKQRNYLGMTRINANLHIRLARSTENEYVLGFAERLQNQARRVSYYIFLADRDASQYAAHQRKVTSDHASIIKAVEDGDNHELVRLLTAHAGLFQERIKTVIDASRAAEWPILPKG
jgi:DNA-binding GntR family transcriptional regulator